MNESEMNNEQLRLQVQQKLVESGQKEMMKEQLKLRLTESGWRDRLKAHCKEVLKNKKDSNVTVEDLVSEITPFARSTVPEDVKTELTLKIKAFIEENFNE